MIDWDKPIETVDGRRAKVLTCVAAGEKHGRSVYITPKDDFGFGDVFIVDDEGYRCDDRAIYSKRQEPFIRNARVKREGWVNIYHVHETEAAAIQCRSQNEGVVTRFVRWEE